MGLREWANQNSTVMTILFVVVLIVSLGSILMQSSGGDMKRYTYGYFFDVGSGELFVRKNTEVPPIDAPSGAGKGVRAVVFSCTDCDDKKTHFTGWLETYTPEAKEELLNPPPPINPEDPTSGMTGAVERGHRIAAAPTGAAEPQWMLMSSPQGSQIMKQIRSKCAKAAVCNPVSSDIP